MDLPSNPQLWARSHRAERTLSCALSSPSWMERASAARRCNRGSVLLLCGHQQFFSPAALWLSSEAVSASSKIPAFPGCLLQPCL